MTGGIPCHILRTDATNKEIEMADVQGVQGERLKQYIERVERLTEEKEGIASDITDVYAEAKSAGFDSKIMKMIVRLRKMASEKRREEEDMLEIYKAAIGLE